jgi:hypothetical protein
LQRSTRAALTISSLLLRGVTRALSVFAHLAGPITLPLARRNACSLACSSTRRHRASGSPPVATSCTPNLLANTTATRADDMAAESRGAGPVVLMRPSDRLDPHTPLRTDKISKKVCDALSTRPPTHTHVARSHFVHTFLSQQPTHNRITTSRAHAAPSLCLRPRGSFTWPADITCTSHLRLNRTNTHHHRVSLVTHMSAVATPFFFCSSPKCADV